MKVIIPVNAEEVIILAENILAKHTADGANSPLNNLNMADMQAKTTFARTQHDLSEQQSRDAEMATQDRNLALGLEHRFVADTVVFYITSVRDFLIGQFRGKEQHLGQWGFNVNMSGQGITVEIPKSALEIMQLAEKILAKHTADGANSLLNSFNMADMQNKLNTAEQQHDLAKQLKKESEIATQARNSALGWGKKQNTYTFDTVQFYVVSSRDILLGLFRGREKKLGEWGFVVDEGSGSGTPTPPPAPTYTIVMATNQSSPAPVNIVLMGENGKTITVNWGDGTTETFTMNGNYVIAQHNYTAGNYTIRLTGEKEAFLEMFAPDCKITAINLPPELTLLRAIDLLNNLLTSFFLPTTYVLMLSLQLNSNGLDQQSVNQTLITMNGFNTNDGLLNLAGGTNQKPSGQGIAAMNQLLQRNWNVVTN